MDAQPEDLERPTTPSLMGDIEEDCLDTYGYRVVVSARDRTQQQTGALKERI